MTTNASHVEPRSAARAREEKWSKAAELIEKYPCMADELRAMLRREMESFMDFNAGEPSRPEASLSTATYAHNTPSVLAVSMRDEFPRSVSILSAPTACVQATLLHTASDDSKPLDEIMAPTQKSGESRRTTEHSWLAVGEDLSSNEDCLDLDDTAYMDTESGEDVGLSVCDTLTSGAPAPTSTVEKTYIPFHLVSSQRKRAFTGSVSAAVQPRAARLRTPSASLEPMTVTAPQRRRKRRLAEDEETPEEETFPEDGDGNRPLEPACKRARYASVSPPGMSSVPFDDYLVHERSPSDNNRSLVPHNLVEETPRPAPVDNASVTLAPLPMPRPTALPHVVPDVHVSRDTQEVPSMRKLATGRADYEFNDVGRELLEAAFEKNPHPHRKELNDIRASFGLPAIYSQLLECPIYRWFSRQRLLVAEMRINDERAAFYASWKSSIHASRSPVRTAAPQALATPVASSKVGAPPCEPDQALDDATMDPNSDSDDAADEAEFDGRATAQQHARHRGGAR